MCNVRYSTSRRIIQDMVGSMVIDASFHTHETESKLIYKVEPGAIIYPNCVIGEGSIIGANAVLRPYTRIGRNTIFGTLSCSEGHNEIGDFTTIHAQCHITSNVRIGNNVFIAPFFIATNTPIITFGKHGTHSSQKPETLPTVIEDYVKIGANVRMIPGLTIGKGSWIDQDCLITHDVPAGSHIRGGKDKVGRVVGRTN
jgi:UDP-3-O-[3-hydroxymyristoyl] glucosamine N-acyltransferase